MTLLKKIISQASLFYVFFSLYVLLGAYLLVNTEKGVVNLWINSFHQPIFDLYFKYITYLGDGIFAAPLVCLLFLFYNKFRALFILAAILGTFLIVHILKVYVYPEALRPKSYFSHGEEIHYVEGVEVHGHNSFPSGHTAQAFAIFCAFSAWTKNKRTQLLYLFFAFSTAISRLYLMQHFLLDVWMGAIIATFTTTLLLWLLEKYFPEWKNTTKLNRPLISLSND